LLIGWSCFFVIYFVLISDILNYIFLFVAFAAKMQ